MFSVLFTDRAKKELKKIDKYTATLLIAWIRKNLEGCTNPRQYGKKLLGERDSQWSYRIGDYRILAEIRDMEILILVIAVGHRKHIYKMK